MSLGLFRGERNHIRSGWIDLLPMVRWSLLIPIALPRTSCWPGIGVVSRSRRGVTRTLNRLGEPAQVTW